MLVSGSIATLEPCRKPSVSVMLPSLSVTYDLRIGDAPYASPILGTRMCAINGVRWPSSPHPSVPVALSGCHICKPGSHLMDHRRIASVLVHYLRIVRHHHLALRNPLERRF